MASSFCKAFHPQFLCALLYIYTLSVLDIPMKQKAHRHFDRNCLKKPFRRTQWFGPFLSKQDADLNLS